MGPHSCPAKELTVPVVIVRLDELSSRCDLKTLRTLNPAF